MAKSLQEAVQPAGAWCRPGGSCEFTVWAPLHEHVRLVLLDAGREGRAIPSSHNSLSRGAAWERVVQMQRNELGYFSARVDDTGANCQYLYELGNAAKAKRRPDPASRFQPDGVHGASAVVDLDGFAWSDPGFSAPSLEDSVFYELHVGAYTSEGTLDALIPELPNLASLGVTTVEIMPVAQFPGARNWGYDGVYPYAVQNTYGGPVALQRFVNAAHGHGLAVALDVVYNHLGPEGNYLADFGPYFTERYKSNWGQAINFDGAQAEPVRRFFIDNAIYWFEKFHIDVLRLDAIHGIFDFGAKHFLAELQGAVVETEKRLHRRLTLVAESDLNDARVLEPFERGGYAIAAQWSDDFHHAVHTLLTGEKKGYYADFGQLKDLGNVLRDGWLYHGQYSVARKRRHGNSPRNIAKSRLLAYSQNHDQVGNRARGERLKQLAGLEGQKLAAGVTLLSPFVPMIFMGEEFGETAPFLYFTDHGDEHLIRAVREGRRAEFAEFGWQGEVPDPQDQTTFEKSKVGKQRASKDCETVRGFYCLLLRIRREHRLGSCRDWMVSEDEGKRTLTVIAKVPSGELRVIFNFGDAVAVPVPTAAAGMPWSVAVHSADAKWAGVGTLCSEGDEIRGEGSITLPAKSFVVLTAKGQTTRRDRALHPALRRAGRRWRGR